MIYISRNKAGIALLLIFALALLAMTHYASESITAGSQLYDERAIAVPAIMYHSVVTKKEKLGEYVLHVDELESDLQYLKDNGYTPVFLSDLLHYQQGWAFPYEKPILLTFDDGFYNNYSVVFPLFQKYEMKFSLAVVASYADKETELGQAQAEYYSYCTWEQLREMQASGTVELLNHTESMHSIGARMGVLQKKSESDIEYFRNLSEDISYCQEKLSSVGMPYKFMVYPYGYYNQKTEKTLGDMGFEATLTCAEGINYVTQSSSLMKMKRYNRMHGVSSEAFFAKVLGQIKEQ